MYQVPVPSMPAWHYPYAQDMSMVPPVPEKPQIPGAHMGFMQPYVPQVSMQPYSVPQPAPQLVAQPQPAQPAAMHPMVPPGWSQPNPWAQHAEYWNQAAAMQAAQLPLPQQFLPPHSFQPQLPQAQVSQPAPSLQPQPPGPTHILPAQTPQQQKQPPPPTQQQQPQVGEQPEAPQQPQPPQPQPLVPAAQPQPQYQAPPEPTQPPPQVQQQQQQISEQQQAYNQWLQQQTIVSSVAGTQPTMQQQTDPRQNRSDKAELTAQPSTARENNQQVPATAQSDTSPNKNSIPQLTSQQQAIIKNFSSPVPPQDPRQTTGKPIDPIREPPPPPPPKKSDGPETNSSANLTSKQNVNTPGVTSEKTENTVAQETLSSLRVQLETLEKQIKTYQIEYQKWHQDFVKWQKQHQNHPDQKKYIDYQKQYQKMIEEQQSQLKQQYGELQKKINKRKEEQKAAAAAKTVSMIISSAAKKVKARTAQLQQIQSQQTHGQPETDVAGENVTSAPPSSSAGHSIISQTSQVHEPPPPPPPPGSPGRGRYAPLHTIADSDASSTANSVTSSANALPPPTTTGTQHQSDDATNLNIAEKVNDQQYPSETYVNQPMVNGQQHTNDSSTSQDDIHPSSSDDQNLDTSTSSPNVTIPGDEERDKSVGVSCTTNDALLQRNMQLDVPKSEAFDNTHTKNYHPQAVQNETGDVPKPHLFVPHSQPLSQANEPHFESQGNQTQVNMSQPQYNHSQMSGPYPQMQVQNQWPRDVPPNPQLANQNQWPSDMPPRPTRPSDFPPNSQIDQNSLNNVPSKPLGPDQLPPSSQMGNQSPWASDRPPGLMRPEEFLLNSQTGDKSPWASDRPPRPMMPEEFPPHSQIGNQSPWASDRPPRPMRPEEFPPSSQVGNRSPWASDRPPRPMRPDEFHPSSPRGNQSHWPRNIPPSPIRPGEFPPLQMGNRSPWTSDRLPCPVRPDELPPNSQMNTQDSWSNNPPNSMSEKEEPQSEKLPPTSLMEREQHLPCGMPPKPMMEKQGNWSSGPPPNPQLPRPGPWSSELPPHSGIEKTNPWSDKFPPSLQMENHATWPGDQFPKKDNRNELTSHFDRPDMVGNCSQFDGHYPSKNDNPPCDNHEEDEKKDLQRGRQYSQVFHSYSDEPSLGNHVRHEEDKHNKQMDIPQSRSAGSDHPMHDLHFQDDTPRVSRDEPSHTDVPSSLSGVSQSHEDNSFSRDEEGSNIQPVDNASERNVADKVENYLQEIVKRPSCENPDSSGNKCKFQHPLCKANRSCVDPECPVEHSSERDMDDVKVNEGPSPKPEVVIPMEERAFILGQFINQGTPPTKKGYPKPAAVDNLDAAYERAMLQRGKEGSEENDSFGPPGHAPPDFLQRGVENMNSMSNGPSMPGPWSSNIPGDMPTRGFPSNDFLLRGALPPNIPGPRQHFTPRGGPQLGPGGLHPPLPLSVDRPQHPEYFEDLRKEGARIPPPVDYSPKSKHLRNVPRGDILPPDNRGSGPLRDLPPRGFPSQDFLERDLPPRDFPSRDFLPRDFPPRDFPPRDLPPRDLPPRDLPPRDLPPRDFLPRDFLPRDMPPRDMPPRDMPPRDMPPRDMPHPGMSHPGTPHPGMPPPDMPPRDMPPGDIPPRDMPPRGFPPRDFPPKDFPLRDLPPMEFPPRGLLSKDLPSRDFPPRELPPRELPPRDFPPRGMMGRDGPRDEPTKDESCRGFPMRDLPRHDYRPLGIPPFPEHGLPHDEIESKDKVDRTEDSDKEAACRESSQEKPGENKTENDDGSQEQDSNNKKDKHNQQTECETGGKRGCKSPTSEEERRRQEVLGIVGNAPMPPRMPEGYRKRDLPPGMCGDLPNSPKHTRLNDSMEYERRKREILGGGRHGGPGISDEHERDQVRWKLDGRWPGPRPPSPGFRGDSARDMLLQHSPSGDIRFRNRGGDFRNHLDNFPCDNHRDNPPFEPLRVSDGHAVDFRKLPPGGRRMDEQVIPHGDRRSNDRHVNDRVPPIHRFSDESGRGGLDRPRDMIDDKMDVSRRYHDMPVRDLPKALKDRIEPTKENIGADKRDRCGSPHRDSPHRRGKHNYHGSPKRESASEHSRRPDSHDREHRERDRPHKDSPRDSKKNEVPPLNSPRMPQSELKPEVFSASDIFDNPGRETRPRNIVIILRGIPGSGKSYMAKLIKDKEAEHGAQPPRILALDDYFMQDVEKSDKKGGKANAAVVKRQEYVYEADMEAAYRGSLLKAFNKTLNDGFFPMVIVDAINHKASHFDQFWSDAKHKGFEVFISELKGDTKECLERSVNKRSEEDVKKMLKTWEDAPVYYKQLDISSLLQDAAINDVEMEETVEGVEREESPVKKEEEDDEELHTTFHIPKSKWEDSKEVTLAKLDGVSKRKSKDTKSNSPLLDDDEDDPYDEKEADMRLGKKRVRWADVEEKKQLDHQKKIGFSIGMDWKIFTDPNAQIPK